MFREITMPPGRRRPLEPDRDVHAIAVQLVVVDDEVAEVQADAEHDGAVRRLTAIDVEHRLLDPDGSAQRPVQLCHIPSSNTARFAARNIPLAVTMTPVGLTICPSAMGVYLAPFSTCAA
jgi:hypothetical protein